VKKVSIYISSTPYVIPKWLVQGKRTRIVFGKYPSRMSAVSAAIWYRPLVDMYMSYSWVSFW